MALIDFDGFDAGDMSLKWSAAGSPVWIAVAASRYGTGRVAQSANPNSIMQKSFTPVAQVILGFAYTHSSPNTGLDFLLLYGDTMGTAHLTLRWVSSGVLGLYRGGTQIATATVTNPAQTSNLWIYIEVSATINDTTGTCVVRVDGTTVINFTGDTKNAGTNSTIDGVRFYKDANNGVNEFIDDFYLLDGTGSAPYNTFLGEVRVYTTVPTGAGASTQWTPSTGANWAAVDELPYSATDYVFTATAGNRDTYVMSDIPTNVGTVFGVRTSAIAKRTDVGTTSLRVVDRSGSTNYYSSATGLTTADGYAPGALRTVDPATSAAWTVSGVNALEAGVEIATVVTAVANWSPTETSGTTMTDSIGGVVMTLQGDASLVAAQLHGHSCLRTATGVPGAIDLVGGATTPVPSTAITAMCWVRTTSTVASLFGTVMSKAATSYDTYGLYAHYGSGLADTPSCQMSTTSNPSVAISASSALLADHAWHHLAVTYDGATVKLYCDGTQIGSTSATGTLVYDPSYRFVVMGDDHFGNKLVGDGAEFKIFDVALTQAQIIAAMA